MPAPLDGLAVDALSFADDGRIPNNPALPLLLYRGARVPLPAACPVYGGAGPLVRLWRGG